MSDQIDLYAHNEYEEGVREYLSEGEEHSEELLNAIDDERPLYEAGFTFEMQDGKLTCVEAKVHGVILKPSIAS